MARDPLQSRWAVWSFVIVGGTIASYASIAQPAASEKNAIDSDVLAIRAQAVFRRNCVKCHGPVKAKGGLRLDTKRHAESGGRSGAPILGGTPQTNEIYRRVAADNEDDRMPQEAAPLPDSEIELIRQWVQSGTPWPGDQEEVELTGWQLIIESIQIGFDRYIRPEAPWIAALLITILLIERCKVARKPGPTTAADGRAAGEKPRGVVGRVSRVPRALYLVGILGVLLAREARVNTDLRRQVARLSAVKQTSGIPPKIRFIYGFPPRPFRPDQPQRLGGEYYRGNCERNERLFNHGNYLTAYLRATLHDPDGRKLQIGDEAPPGGLYIHFEIERAPNATPSLFSDRIMLNTFLSSEIYPDSAVDPIDKPVWMQAVEPRQRWRAVYRIADTRRDPQRDLSGIVYVYKGVKSQGRIGGEIHYGIQYKLKFDGGRIAEGSDMWMGAIFWNASIALPTDDSKIPFDQWFSAHPLPIITGENTKDPELLGIDDYPEADTNPKSE